MMVKADEHKNALGKYVQMCLLINEMDRQQIHHKYRQNEKSINMFFRLCFLYLESFNIIRMAR